MITYSLLLVAGIVLLVKWARLHRYKKKALTRELIDDALIDRLNRKERSHAD